MYVSFSMVMLNCQRVIWIDVDSQKETEIDRVKGCKVVPAREKNVGS